MTDETPSGTWPPTSQSVGPQVRPTREILPCRRGFKLLAALTTVLGVFPYLIYVPARLTAALPDEAAFDKTSAAGGPWEGETLGDLVSAPMLLLALLALVTLLVCVDVAVRSRRGRVAALGTGFAVVQMGLALLQLYTVSWVTG